MNITINRCGCTRIVILTKRYAFKIPNFLTEYRLGLLGLLANMQEVSFSKVGYPELCPVLFSLPFGWLLIMPRLREMTDVEFMTFDIKKWMNDAHKSGYVIPVENKPNSFGYMNGRIVAIDYGS